jgi:hypothetical protein
MIVWRLRLLLIGAINAIIGIFVGIFRGYSIVVIGYIAVSLVVCLIGLIWKPKEKKKVNNIN